MTSDAAKQAYREAWAQYCLTRDFRTKMLLESRMDGLQCLISERPGKDWDDFAATLPGFREMWGRWETELHEISDKVFGKRRPDA